MSTSYYIIYSDCGKQLNKVKFGTFTGGLNFYLQCDYLLESLFPYNFDNPKFKCPENSVQKIKLTCWGIDEDCVEISRCLTIKFKIKDNNNGR